MFSCPLWHNGIAPATATKVCVLLPYNALFFYCVFKMCFPSCFFLGISKQEYFTVPWMMVWNELNYFCLKKKAGLLHLNLNYFIFEITIWIIFQVQLLNWDVTELFFLSKLNLLVDQICNWRYFFVIVKRFCETFRRLTGGIYINNDVLVKTWRNLH